MRDQLVEVLGRGIVNGELRPGDILPGEAELLERYSVSRTVLREAMQVLSAKGMIDSRQRRGTTVRPRADWSQLDQTLLEWHGTSDVADSALQQLMEVRRIVEPPAAALAAERADQAQRQRIAAAYAEMERSRGKVEEFMTADLEFHTSILEASGNQFLLPIAQAIRTTLTASLKITNPRPDENHRVSLPLHKAILDAILKRDAQAAFSAMQTHLDDTEKRRAKWKTTAKRSAK
ncbi:FadR/GntR family transcriptional regulator [Caballeronia sp. ATUFL_M1_KS5A]|uniref:FadR/GntR family transcriptional regulator n=1 Tax=Caballeronia sp. ATUFL_M1_KS5A TaxID=2921778 RepID=UPI002028FB8D|nr:FadR/GntR family transcriptional regulator [Caballeronia sp. ATUFL_M1_KS5A]